MFIDILANIQKTVTATHGCECSHEATSFVHALMKGKTVWRGVVDTFKLHGHSRAAKAFAWAYRDARGEVHYIAVLSVPPLLSPHDAVQAAIADGQMA